MPNDPLEKKLVIVDGDLRLLVERGETMYVVSSPDIQGLNTQGKTIEEAIRNAHDAARLLAEYREQLDDMEDRDLLNERKKGPFVKVDLDSL